MNEWIWFSWQTHIFNNKWMNIRNIADDKIDIKTWRTINGMYSLSNLQRLNEVTISNFNSTRTYASVKQMEHGSLCLSLSDSFTQPSTHPHTHTCFVQYWWVYGWMETHKHICALFINPPKIRWYPSIYFIYLIDSRQQFKRTHTHATHTCTLLSASG